MTIKTTCAGHTTQNGKWFKTMRVFTTVRHEKPGTINDLITAKRRADARKYAERKRATKAGEA